MSNAIHISYSSPLLPAVSGGRIERSLPSSWEEMNPSSIWPVVDLLYQAAPMGRVVKQLLQLPQPIFRRITRGEMYDLIRCLDWMRIDHESPRPLASYIDHRSRSGKVTRLHLPGDRFQNVSGMEYALIDDKYSQFRTSLDPDIQAQMIAIVLRPEGPSPDPSSDPRVQLKSEPQTSEWLPMVRALPSGVRDYLTTLISANRLFIHTAYQHWLFTDAPAAAEGETEEAPAQEGLDFGWWGCFMDIAADGVFGDFDAVCQAPIHTLCQYMSRKVDRARAEKQAQDHALARAGI